VLLPLSIIASTAALPNHLSLHPSAANTNDSGRNCVFHPDGSSSNSAYDGAILNNGNVTHSSLSSQSQYQQ
jgi:hypothetical protein